MCVNYLFAVPLALGLLLGPADMGVKAIYLGLGIGLGVMTVIEAVVLHFRTWTKTESVEEGLT